MRLTVLIDSREFNYVVGFIAIHRCRNRELWLNLGDGVNQAANLISSVTSIPSLNFTPLMTFGN